MTNQDIICQNFQIAEPAYDYITGKLLTPYKNDICYSIGNACVVKFKDMERAPMFGYFVEMHDSEELAVKGMARFVSRSRDEDFYNYPSTQHTRIFFVSTFKSIEYGNCSG